MAVLAGGFLFGLWKLYELRFAAGDIYPPYSSLRADPLGAKAFFDSVGQLPGMSATRNYLPLSNFPKGKATVFYLGVDPFIFEAKPEEQIKELETLATGGARVVIAMTPVSRLPEPKKSTGDEKHEPGAVAKRWGITFGYITKSAKEAEEETGRPKLTALYFRSEGKVLYQVERRFGNGIVVLLANCYPMSNEALARERDTKALISALGDNRKIVFDERHLGLSENAGVVTLARKYHLEGLAAALLLLLGLFIWKNSSSFLPARREHIDGDESVAAKDASSGLANLLRRNIPAKALMKTCLREWEQSQHGGRYYSQAKIERVRALAKWEGDVPETYRKVSSILAERSHK